MADKQPFGVPSWWTPMHLVNNWSRNEYEHQPLTQSLQKLMIVGRCPHLEEPVLRIDYLIVLEHFLSHRCFLQVFNLGNGEFSQYQSNPCI
jgi:hypothetical protein